MSGTAILGYLRRSYADERRPGEVSESMQQAAIRRIVEEKGEDPDQIEWLTDWSVSGGKRAEARRPEWQRLNAMVAAGEVAVVASYDMDRLSRDTSTVLDFAGLCRDRKVRLLLSSGEVDFESAEGEALVAVKAVFARLEHRRSMSRAKAATAARAARGDDLGLPGYGFRRVGTKNVVDEDEMVVVDEMFRRFEQGEAVSAIARWLNESGIQAKRGGPWTRQQVRKCLRRFRPGLFPPGMQKGASGHGKVRFSGLLRCQCGRILTGRIQRGNPEWETYLCKNAQARAHGGRQSISGRKVWADVWEQVGRLQFSIKKTEELEASIAYWVARKDKLVELWLDGGIDKDQYRARKADYEARIDLLRRDEAVRLVLAKPDRSAPSAEWNAWLRRIFVEIRLDEDMMPIEYVPRYDLAQVTVALKGAGGGTSTARGRLTDAPA